MTCLDILAVLLSSVARCAHRAKRACIVLGVFALVLSRLALAGPDSGKVMPVIDADKYAITPFVTLLEDTESKWQIDDVISAELASKFTPAKQDYLNFGYSDSTIWIRLQLRYEPTRKRHPPVQHWIYEVGKAQLNMAELYIQREDGSITHAQADIRIPYDERPLRLVNSVFPITTPKGETVTLYLRVKNVSAFYVPLTLWNPIEFVQKTTREEILYGIFFGGMIIMIVYNLFLFVSIRDPSYIYYSGYLISALVFEAIDMGHGAAWIPEGRTWFNKEYIPIAIWSTWLTAFMFTKHFLEIPKRHPLFNKFLPPLFLFSVICASFCFLIPFKLSLIFSVQFCGYMCATLPLVGAYTWYKGNKNASYFTLAWICNVTGFIMLSSVATGLAPATPLLTGAMPLGTLLEAVMLSFALAERIKRAQKEALHANKLSMQHLAGYRSLFDNALEGIYQTTLRGHLIDANASTAQILGFNSVKALLNSGKKSIAKFFNEPALQWRDLLRGSPLRNEIQCVNEMGNERVVLHSAHLIYDTQGKPAYVEGTVIDITERFQREQAERERVRARHEKATAEAMTQAKSQFLKNMSFEIRSSLAPIIGFSEVLREPALSAGHKGSAIAAIVSNAHTLLQLVNDILDYSKIEAGKMPIEQIDLDLLALINTITAQFTPQANAKQLSFNAQYDWPLPPRIYSDPTRLKQMLQNLCSNAIKYTYTGQITLRIYWDEVSAQLCFAVCDSGPGIAAHDLRLLQEANPAIEASNALQRGGLGIAITRQVAKLLGGRLRVESVPGVGSTFTASIACRTPPRERWVTSAPTDEKSDEKTVNRAAKAPALKGTVLLAEDNVVNQKLISRIISKTGANVTVVGDGEQALMAALENRYDLVLMDVNMPVMGGLEATRALRDKGYDRPIYALTAEHGHEEINASLVAGCNGHLTKPIELEPFYSVLSTYLTAQGANA